MARSFDIVVACDRTGGIGKGGNLPWRLKGDLKNFKELTCVVSKPDCCNAVIMGRKTWDSIPASRRPLPHRMNVVISRAKELALPEGVLLASSLDEALQQLANRPEIENCFVLGGGEIYALALNHPDVKRVYLTLVSGDFDCDTFFPELGPSFTQAEESQENQENDITYCFKVFTKVGPGE